MSERRAAKAFQPRIYAPPGALIRLHCVCGRGLADVTWNEHNPDWTRDRLQVNPRPNVRQDDYRPWHAANSAAGRAAAGPYIPGTLEKLRDNARRERAGEPPLPLPAPPQVDPAAVTAARIAATASSGVEGIDWDWKDHTYTWHCRCGQNLTKRHERISAAWVEHMTGDTKLVRLTVGRDL